jgi:hypothetical protein
MRNFFLHIVIFFITSQTFAQSNAHFSGPFLCWPQVASLQTSPINDVRLESFYKKNKSDIFYTATLKNQATAEKWGTLLANKKEPLPIGFSGLRVSKGFDANPLRSWTPTDNALAVSDSGILVSAINYGIQYFDTNGIALGPELTWSDFINDTLLNQAKYDPRVIFDHQRQRFIVVLLHGFSSATSKVLVCFSKTANPLNGWNIYALPGNPYNDTTWSDYPNIGLSANELFINCNRFGDAPTYRFKETYLYQIGLSEGYAGIALTYGLWNNINTPDGLPGLTLCAATEAHGNYLTDTMHFLMARPDSGSYWYSFRVSGNRNSANKQLSANRHAVPFYSVCGNAFQTDPSTGLLDSLNTANAWMQNAYYENGKLHGTQSANGGSGWCGLIYGQIDLVSQTAYCTQYRAPGTDLSYPAIASLSGNTETETVAMAYVEANPYATPGCGAILLQNQEWGVPQTVRQGDTVVNILYPPNYAVTPERWGDYTGIARQCNSNPPTVWMAGAFGANTPPRKASYGTYIACLQAGSNLPALPVSSFNPRIYPNPTSSQFQCAFTLAQAGVLRIDVVNVLGQIIRPLFNDYLPACYNVLTLNTDGMVPGYYAIRFVQDGRRLQTLPLIVR